MSCTSVPFKSNNFTLAGNLFTPAGSSADSVYAAIVVAHPWGGVKEQTAGRYAKELSDNGFITLAFDAAYQGASTGEPRYLEDPRQRAEDVKAAVTYLSTLKNVDPKRVGALGICASGGYVPFAAQTDLRIKAVATVSAADVGSLLTRPFGGGPIKDDLAQSLENAGQLRIAEAKGEAPHLSNIVPPTKPPAEFPDLYKEGYDYYRTSRGEHKNSANFFVTRSIDLIANYDSYAFNALISPRPLLMIAGTVADTLYFSEDAIAKAKEPKELFLIDGKTHVGLYDDTSISVPKLVDFMNKALSG
ncbi:related to hydrolases of the alpha/beta superfamily [Phialocephala subalpina]|uniref:Related to hydrolases of the alpha/beta superfamily n=1 Tax=Phialocephala subalpina TaxID=576137 RepID=A0A1L7WTU5_9HELO|nr:related to hydrolases of the alpha/beta superfamily [Phialocephala subalpina]